MNRLTIAAPYLKPLVEAIKSIDARSYENAAKEKARKGKTRRQRHR